MEVFSGMLARWAEDKRVELPNQILVEIHMVGNKKKDAPAHRPTANKYDAVATARMTLLVQALTLLGYVSVNMEMNTVVSNGCCAELTLVRAFC